MDTSGVTIIIAAYILGLIASIILIRHILLHELRQAASAAKKRIIWLSFVIGSFVAIFPSFYFGFLFGGNLGGALGASLGELIGIKSKGVTVGIFIGISSVFTLFMVLSSLLSIRISRAIKFKEQ